MNQKIDSTQDKDILCEKEFAAGFLPSLILLTVAILVFVVASENAGWLYNNESKAHYYAPPLFNIFPVIYPSYVTITNVVDTYDPQLELLFTPSFVIKIGLLGSIIVFYSIIPTIFFFHWRRRRIANKTISPNSPLFFSSISYGLSAIIMAFIVISMITVTMSVMFSERDWHSNPEILLNRSEMSNELLLISVDAYQYKLLPTEFGGGNGKYTGFVPSPERTKTQNGIYTVTTSENQLTIEAQSLLFSKNKISSTTIGSGQFGGIIVTVDPQGQIGNWKDLGAFDILHPKEGG